MNVVQFDRTQEAISLLQRAVALLGDDVSGNVLRKTERLLRRSDVEAKTGLKKTAIYSRIKAGTFPASVDIGPGVVRWREGEIDAWLMKHKRTGS